MSADLLRRAAALMWERAREAQASSDESWHTTWTLMGDGKTREDAEHIASWHPAVALAVADWLEETADAWDMNGFIESDDALAVARTYLGSES